MEVIVGIIVIVIAVVLLKGFDGVAGRGPKQVKDGVNSSVVGKAAAGRIACPQCAEMIMPAAKICPFCKSQLKP